MKLRDLRDERGNQNISMVLLMPVVLGIVWLLLQVVIAYLGRDLAINAARAGVDAGRARPVSAARAQLEAQRYVQDSAQRWLSGTVVTASINGNRVQVTVTGQASSIVPLVHPAVHQSAEGPVEQLQGAR